MSLYIIASLVQSQPAKSDLPSLIREIGKQQGIVITFDVDDDDQEYLEGILGSPSNGIYFALCDAPSSSDATCNWIDAMTVARHLVSHEVRDITSLSTADIKSLTFGDAYFDAMRRTRLGSCMTGIIRDTSAVHGCISIADGAFEGEVYLSADECEREILKTMILTWDCLPNLSYVW